MDGITSPITSLLVECSTDLLGRFAIKRTSGGDAVVAVVVVMMSVMIAVRGVGCANG